MARYGSLSLPADVETQRSKRSVVVIATAIVSVAAVSALLVGGTAIMHTSSVVDAYDAMEATPVNCDKLSPSYHDDLPKWDPQYQPDPKDFYNACYYSFRCCTTTANGNGCYVSDSFGPRCKGCLAANAPLQVRLPCKLWLNDNDVAEKDWLEEDLMTDNGLPATTIEEYQVQFANINNNSCWSQGAASTYEDFADKCFQVLSWCNLLCPRDTPQTVDHVMCKHCTLNGFAQGYFDATNFEASLASADISDGEAEALA